MVLSAASLEPALAARTSIRLVRYAVLLFVCFFEAGFFDIAMIKTTKNQ